MGTEAGAGQGLAGEVLAGDHILAARIGLLERRLAALAGLVTSKGGLAPEGLQAGVPAFVQIDAESQREMATGFHLREYDEAGRAFRWAGRADHFEFRFFLDRRSARPFAMRGLFAPGIDTGQLRAYVDYRAIPASITVHEGMAVVAGRVPADPLGHAVTLTFHCPVKPASLAEDRRLLSFAFSSLAVGTPLAATRAVSPRAAMPRTRTRRAAGA